VPPAPTALGAPPSPQPPLQSASASIAVNGNGAVEGRIADPTGAAIPNAQVTLTNTDTGAQLTRSSDQAGFYSIVSLPPGNYNLEVFARGFQRLLQENVIVSGNMIARLDPNLTIGGQNTTVTVTNAPPFIDTADSALGGTIENELYSQLPLSMNGGPRDPTAFQYLMPGVQDASAGLAGTGNSSIAAGPGNQKPLPPLPSKLPAISAVERAGRTLALDTTGALFFSDDAGATWHLVPIQWQGRALTLRLARPPSAPPQDSANPANAAASNPQPQTLVPDFELTTGSGARYTSADGQTWQRR
jgi:hypothetical protein